MESLRHIYRTPLPGLAGKPGTRFSLRLTLMLGRRLIGRIEGEERLLDTDGPHIVALNHNQYLEAILVPGILAWIRSGKLVHFLADWNFLMVPVVSTLLRQGEVIPVTHKTARPRFLTPLRDKLVKGKHGLDLARRYLHEGKWVGIFPEGKANPNHEKLMPGYRGAAQLAIETNTPIIPIGIRFPNVDPGKRIPKLARLNLHIGTPISPAKYSESGLSGSRALHATLMNSLSTLSGKSWKP